MLKEKLFLIGLASIPNIGGRRIIKLLEYFEGAERAWKASKPEWLAVPGIGEKVWESFDYYRRSFNPSSIEKKLKELNIQVITIFEKDYPALLKEIFDPPVLLYCRGKLSNNCLAIVGSRRASGVGKEIAYQFAQRLARQGLTIVSGLARGIDSQAHKGALDAGGRTIAVLGSGIDVCYPPENRHLFKNIEENGAVISEFPLGTPPHAANFPARNRIISGLSKGVLVVEAAEKSGALITADFAIEQGREVFAIPGSIISTNSKGTNYLIQQGAKLVQNIEDITDEFFGFQLETMWDKSCEENPESSSEESRLLSVIGDYPLHIEEIAQRIDIPYRTLSVVLLDLELRGLIKQLPGSYYFRVQ